MSIIRRSLDEDVFAVLREANGPFRERDGTAPGHPKHAARCRRVCPSQVVQVIDPPPGAYVISETWCSLSKRVACHLVPRIRSATAARC